ncbi:Proline-rich receptor-like protein kinase PERK4 [Zea mays]|uniref:Proline-rich receptor-like protein kinase PERK4 n=1 Tax=Zea mays TaxID=4577 RepID=A0A1D6JV63_MAIZE|nr:Proline-rich receptor-like protein kinase PERK4 [Zea mays]
MTRRRRLLPTRRRRLLPTHRRRHPSPPARACRRWASPRARSRTRAASSATTTAGQASTAPTPGKRRPSGSNIADLLVRDACVVYNIYTKGSMSTVGYYQRYPTLDRDSFSTCNDAHKMSCNVRICV